MLVTFLDWIFKDMYKINSEIGGKVLKISFFLPWSLYDVNEEK